jgi:uncharacterized protein YacL
MSQRLTRLLILHGALMIFIGMILGLLYSSAITENWGLEATRDWRVAHTSVVVVGTFHLAIAGVASHLVLNHRAARVLVGSLVSTVYSFSSAMILGAAIGARGLEASGPPLHLLVFGLMAVSILALFVAAVLLLWGAYAGVRSSDP